MPFSRSTFQAGVEEPFQPYRGASLIRNSAPIGPFSRAMPRALRWSWGGWAFLMSEVPLDQPPETLLTIAGGAYRKRTFKAPVSF